MRLALAVAFALFVAAPAQAATVTVHALDTPGWDQTVVDVQPGDTVVWTFAGTTQAHNVEAASANWALASPITVAGPDVLHPFDVEGSYDFVCRVHPDTMKGTVRVASAPPPPPPPPPLSAQPFVNDSPPPATPEKVSLDRAAPKLSAVSARRVGRRARVRFRVSEESVVQVRFKRGSRVVRTVSWSGTGTRSLSVSMRSGRYRVEVRATDLAGNRSALRRARLTMT